MSRLRAPLVALAASFAVVLLAAPPQVEAQISNATLDEPAAESVVGVARVPLSGSFSVDRGDRRINVGVKRDLPDAPTATFSSASFSGDSFSFETSPDFAYNGRYLVDVVFVNSGDDRNTMFGGCGDTPCTRQYQRVVYLAAPPATPAKIAATYADRERKVTLTWAEASELDILGWTIRRSVDGGEHTDVGSLKATKTPSFVDTALPDAGGKLEYHVIAARAGRSDQEPVFSKPGVKVVGVAPRPPDAPPTTVPRGGTTTTVSPFGPVVTAPPSTMTGRPRVSGNVDDFAKGLQGRPKGATRSTLADGTYEETLPYGEAEELEPGGEEEAQRVFKDDPSEDGNRLSAIFYVAASALALVVAAHGLFLLRQVKRADLAELEALPVAVDPVEATALPARAVRQPRVAARLPAPEDVPPPTPKRVPRRAR